MSWFCSDFHFLHTLRLILVSCGTCSQASHSASPSPLSLREVPQHRVPTPPPTSLQPSPVRTRAAAFLRWLSRLWPNPVVSHSHLPSRCAGCTYRDVTVAPAEAGTPGTPEFRVSLCHNPRRCTGVVLVQRLRDWAWPWRLRSAIFTKLYTHTRLRCYVGGAESKSRPNAGKGAKDRTTDA